MSGSHHEPVSSSGTSRPREKKTSDLAIEAARSALASADIEAGDLDFIIVATATPDQTFPATATVVQRELGMTSGAAFDLQAVCSGFIYALSVADNFIKAGAGERILVIGAETFSRILDWEDRTTCVLFGDGAGAVVLRAEEGNGDREDRGILSTCLHSDGRNHDALYVDGGPSSTQTTGYLRMNGKEVFRHAVVNLSSVIQEALDGVGLTADDLDWIVPHQANQRILDSTARAARITARQDHFHNCRPRQHVGRIGTAGLGPRCRRWPHQAGTLGSDGGDGWWLYLGIVPRALVGGVCPRLQTT